jgi:hypothetical protein
VHPWPAVGAATHKSIISAGPGSSDFRVREQLQLMPSVKLNGSFFDGFYARPGTCSACGTGSAPYDGDRRGDSRRWASIAGRSGSTSRIAAADASIWFVIASGPVPR